MTKNSITSRLVPLLALIVFCGYTVFVAYSKYGKPDATGWQFLLGVDLAGGSYLIYEVDHAYWDGLSPQAREEFSADTLANRLKKRIDPDNRKEVVIRPIRATPPRVELILPIKPTRKDAPASDSGGSEIDRIKRLITAVGRLEFRILAHQLNDTDRDALRDIQRSMEGYVAEADAVPPVPQEYRDSYQWVELDRRETDISQLRGLEGVQSTRTALYFCAPKVGPNGRYFALTRLPNAADAVTGDDLIRVGKDRDRGSDGVMQTVVRFSLSGTAPDRFYELTKDVGAKMAIIYDNKITSAPYLNARLRDGGIITMGATGPEGERRVDELIQILQAGQLPATLNPQPVSELSMGPGLGEDTIRKGAYSVGGAFLATIVFMLLYYRFAGLVASIALFCNLLFTVAFMIIFGAAFTLPGLAGLVLMLGMAVDANVLIYERIREERERGATLPAAIRLGFDRSFATIFDTHVTSIVTAIILYSVGTDQLKGFGISLTVGLVISLYTALVVTRLIFDIGLAQGWLTQLVMFKFFSKPNIDFMRVRNTWFAITVILAVLGLALFIWRGEEGLNIDFTGGTAYSVQFKEPQDIARVRAGVVGKLPEPSVDALYRGDASGGKTRDFTIRTTLKDVAKVRDIVKQAFGADLRLINVTASKVEPVMEDLNERVEISVENLLSDGTVDENRGLSESEIEQAVEAWFKKEQITKPASFFKVKGIEAADRAGQFKKFVLQFKKPDELPSMKSEDLVNAVVAAFQGQPVYDRLVNFDSQLAQETQGRALGAIVLSWVAVSGYLWFRFGNWTFGVAAVLCLIHDLMMTVGIICLAAIVAHNMPGVASLLLLDEFKLDLPAIAALLTLIGFSVNDTIVVFDRIREVRGKNPELTPQMINESVNQTLSRTLLTSFTVWLVVVVLYIWGGEGIHLFSFVMVVGAIVGTYSSIFVASPLLLFFGEGQTETRPGERRLQPAKV
jgi:SecD/SecF fusion protein